MAVGGEDRWLCRGAVGDTIIETGVTRLTGGGDVLGLDRRNRAGRQYDRGDVKGLVKLLADRDADVRALAASYLAMLHDPSAVEPLIRSLDDSDYRVQAQAAHALHEIGGPRALEALASVLDSDVEGVVRAAACAMAEVGDPRSVAPLIRLVAEAKYVSLNLGARRASLDPYRWHGVLVGIGLAAVPGARSMLDDPDVRVRDEALQVIVGICRERRVVDPLVDLLGHDRQEVRWPAVEQLGKLGDPVAFDALTRSLTDPDAGIRWRAAEALGTLQEGRATGPLVAALEDPDWRVVHCAAWALAEVGAREEIGALVPLLCSPHREVRRRAAQALDELAWDPPDAHHRALQAMALEEWDEVEALGHAATAALAGALEVIPYSFRRGAAQTLDRIGWDPADERQRLLLALAAGDWEAVAAFGATAAEDLAALFAERPQDDGFPLSSTFVPPDVAHALAQLDDPRAIPVLVAQLRRDVPPARAARERERAAFDQAMSETDEYHGQWAEINWEEVQHVVEWQEQDIDRAIRDLGRFGPAGREALRAGLHDKPDILAYIDDRSAQLEQHRRQSRPSAR